MSWLRSPRPAASFVLSRAAMPALDDLGTRFDPYRPLFDAPAEAGHELIRGWPVIGELVRPADPEGFLRPADALTLYDMARYQPGPVLELGAAWGLSTTILCRGVKARGVKARGAGRVVSMEIDPAFQAASVASVRRAGLSRWHEMRAGDAGVLMRDAAARGETFGAMFIDHDHGLAASRLACELLPDLLRPGGLALFHDFIDARNRTGEYGVHQAVREMLEASPSLALHGTPGCCALVRRS